MRDEDYCNGHRGSASCAEVQARALFVASFRVSRESKFDHLEM